MSATESPSTIAVPAEFGAPFEGGYYAGKLNVNGVPHAVACAGKNGELKGAWLDRYEAVLGARSLHDSMGNTRAMAEAGSAAAKAVLALQIGGVGGWCIPARDVLELCYRTLKPTTVENHVYRSGENPSSLPPGYPYTDTDPAQCKAANFAFGGADAFESAWYLSSSQLDADYAWHQNFTSGNQDFDLLTFEARVRAVRLIPLQPL